MLSIELGVLALVATAEGAVLGALLAPEEGAVVGAELAPPDAPPADGEDVGLEPEPPVPEPVPVFEPEDVESGFAPTVAPPPLQAARATVARMKSAGISAERSER
jgi:hypothetical protein